MHQTNDMRNVYLVTIISYHILIQLIILLCAQNRC